MICSKVKKILKDSLDFSHPLQWKFKLCAGNFAWGVKAQRSWASPTNFLYSKVCWQYPAMFCLYTFPAHNLDFHWRWIGWDQIRAISLNLFYFTVIPHILSPLEQLYSFRCKNLVYCVKKNETCAKYLNFLQFPNSKKEMR